MKKKNKGITLIALVITIIVLLILAGITITTLAGNNGILTKSDMAQEETRGATVEEIKNLWKMEQSSDKFIEENNAQTLDEVLDSLESDGLITLEEKIIIKEDGEVTIGSRTIFQKISAADKVGNIVNDNKDADGNIDYEKLKEDLENLKGIEKAPSDLTAEKLPLVIRVDDEFIQINPDGSTRYR